MTATAGAADSGPASRFGFQPGMVVQELGWDDDVDAELRAGIESVTGSALLDDSYGDVADAVLLWWRADDGDLVVVVESVDQPGLTAVQVDSS